MDTPINNLSWIMVNLALALLPLGFGNIFLRTRQRAVKYFSFLFWFLFLPNTIYLLTDIQYFPDQFFKAGTLFKMVLIAEYGLLITVGIWTYFKAMEPLEKILKAKFKRSPEIRNSIIILVNLVISFAVAIGKVQRTESWYFFTNFTRVVNDSLKTFESLRLMIFVILFAVITNFTYFYLKFTERRH